MTSYATYPSPIGTITLVCREDALTGLWLDSQSGSLEGAIHNPDTPALVRVKLWLDAYFRGEPPEVDFPLSPAGSPFQKQVWEILLSIPYGRTTTYGAIAREISPTMSAQAVGGAVGRNPISIIIPCHRVIGSNGSMTGYAGGLDKKIWLLQHEEEHR